MGQLNTRAGAVLQVEKSLTVRDLLTSPGVQRDGDLQLPLKLLEVRDSEISKVRCSSTSSLLPMADVPQLYGFFAASSVMSSVS